MKGGEVKEMGAGEEEVPWGAGQVRGECRSEGGERPGEGGVYYHKISDRSSGGRTLRGIQAFTLPQINVAC